MALPNICKDGILFTAQDIIEISNVMKERNIHTIEGLVEYFNSKYNCNKVVDLLKALYFEGIKVSPEFNFKPVTEKCLVTNGVFKLSKPPIAMEDSYFINNLVVVRLFDEDKNLTNAYEFFDDPEVDLSNLTVKIDTDKSGIASVSYFTLTDKNT